MRLLQLLVTVFVLALGFYKLQVYAIDLTNSQPLDGPSTIKLSDAPIINNFTCNYEKRMAPMSWTPQENTNNISHYSLEYSTTYSPDEWRCFFDRALNTSYIVVMQPGITFRMRVFAIYKDRNSSQPSEPTAYCETKPNAPYGHPVNVRVKATPPSDLLVTWTQIPPLVHNGPGLFYRVFYRKKDEALEWNVTTITDWRQDRYVIENLPVDKYEVKVVSGNSLGLCRGQPRVVVGYPRLYAPYLSYFKCHEKQADIFWIHQGITDNFDSYSIEYNTTYAPHIWTAIVDKTDAKFHVVPLKPGQTYSFRVVAKFKDAKPEQASAQTQFCTTKSDVPYMNPSNVYVKGGASNELIIFWKAMEKIEQNGPGFFYRVYWRKEGEDWNRETITSSKQNKYVLKYAASVQKLEIKVIAGNDMGESKAEPVVLKV